MCYCWPTLRWCLAPRRCSLPPLARAAGRGLAAAVHGACRMRASHRPAVPSTNEFRTQFPGFGCAAAGAISMLGGESTERPHAAVRTYECLECAKPIPCTLHEAALQGLVLDREPLVVMCSKACSKRFIQPIPHGLVSLPVPRRRRRRPAAAAACSPPSSAPVCYCRAGGSKFRHSVVGYSRPCWRALLSQSPRRPHGGPKRGQARRPASWSACNRLSTIRNRTSSSTRSQQQRSSDSH